MSTLLIRLAGLFALIFVAIGISQMPAASPSLGTPVTYDSPATTTSKSNTPKTKPIAAVAPAKATSTPPKNGISSTPKTATTKTPSATTSTPTAAPVATSNTSITTDASVIALNTSVRSSIVNILCKTNVGDPLKAISATGVVIDPRGVILTNAHVAEYFLLKNYSGSNSVTCGIRTGSPARLAYNAELLFISPQWILDNKNDIIEEQPLGTGEHDYALILITSSVDGSPLPSAFPFTDFAANDSDIDRTGTVPNVIAGYPAGFLGGSEIERDLYVSSAVSTIKDVFTFDTTTVDLMSVGGSVVAQKGASGGAVVSGKTNKLIGLIVTTTDAPTTGERDLRAITLAHVERSMEKESGKTLRGYLSGDLKDTLAQFNGTLYPYLSNILKDVLTKK